MSEKRFDIVGKEFVGYTEGYAYIIRDNLIICEPHRWRQWSVWEDKEDVEDLCDLLNSLNEEKEKAELRENKILQKKLNSLYEDRVNEQNERFFGYDIGEYENMNYAIYDTSKCEKKKEDFWDNEEECYDMRAYTEYLEENDCILSCDEVVKKLNMVNQNCIILAKRLYGVEEESRGRLKEMMKWR